MFSSRLTRVWDHPIVAHSAVLMLGFLLAPPGLYARDGQIDILPDGTSTVVISTAGSYVLVDDVLMTAGAAAIDITVPKVTIDLNGHTLNGNGVGHTGIRVNNNDQCVIFNGKVSGFNNAGINVGTGSWARIHDVIAQANGASGIIGGFSCFIENCTAVQNLGTGITVGDSSAVLNCAATYNIAGGACYGILAGDNCTIENNTCTGNTGSGPTEGAGISVGLSCRVHANTCSGNGSGTGNAFGIIGSDGCTISGNTCKDNVSAKLTGGQAAGIYTPARRCLITDNTCVNNSGGSGNASGAGISVLSGNMISNNTCGLNYGGQTAGAGRGIYAGTLNVISGNLCSGNGAIVGGIGNNGVGIEVFGGANRIFGNSCTENYTNIGGAGGGGSGGGYGIFDNNGTRNQIVGNVCESNGTATGTGNDEGYGIFASSFADIRDNTVEMNRGSGLGIAYGIRVDSDSRVLNNSSFSQSGISAVGIGIIGIRNFVSGNMAGGNGLGIDFLAAGSNRAELNRMTDGIAGSPSSVGTGEFGNVTF